MTKICDLLRKYRNYSRYHTQGNLKEGKVNANTKLEINAAVFLSAKICATCNIIFVDFKTTFLYPRHCLT